MSKKIIIALPHPSRGLRMPLIFIKKGSSVFANTTFFTNVATAAAIVGNERASSDTVSETTPLEIVAFPPLSNERRTSIYYTGMRFQRRDGLICLNERLSIKYDNLLQ